MPASCSAICCPMAPRPRPLRRCCRVLLVAVQSRSSMAGTFLLRFGECCESGPALTSHMTHLGRPRRRPALRVRPSSCLQLRFQGIFLNQLRQRRSALRIGLNPPVPLSLDATAACRHNGDRIDRRYSFSMARRKPDRACSIVAPTFSRSSVSPPLSLCTNRSLGHVRRFRAKHRERREAPFSNCPF